MRRRLVALFIVLWVSPSLGCSSTISGTKGPVPDPGEPDAGVAAADCFHRGDDEGDPAMDCEDPACRRSGSCDGLTRERCDNGVDDDGDGRVDCDDAACWSAAACTAAVEVGCDDDADDDGDGFTDCGDADCFDDPACQGTPAAPPEPDPPPALCGNGSLDAGEECDDGNVVSNDGCDGSCRTEVEDVEGGDEWDDGDEAPVQDVRPGESVDASIDPVGNDDWFRIRLAEGDRLIVETSDGEGSCVVDTVLQLFGDERPDPLPVSTSCEDEADDLLCDDDGGPGMCSRLDATATADGFVHVRVFAFGDDDTGDYRVTFTVVAAAEPDTEDEAEPNDSPELATPIETGDVVEGEIDPASDEDYFTFEVHAFETVRFETSDGEGGCDLDSVLTLYAGLEEPSEGTTCLDDFDAFACDDDDGPGSCSLLEHFFWMDETILARVLSFGHLSTGAYSMSLSVQ